MALFQGTAEARSPVPEVGGDAFAGANLLFG